MNTDKSDVVEYDEIDEDREEAFTGEEIAVIGMAGRFPGASDIHEFWNNLKNGVESVSFLTQPELEAAGFDEEMYSRPDFVKTSGAVLEGKEYFDAAFFGFTPKDAELADPQVRLFYECAWQALESAGYQADYFDGLIGLYAGISPHFNWKIMSMLSPGFGGTGGLQGLVLTNENFVATRISYALNLQGPAVVVQSACSTSLVAIHMACQGILNGEMDMALAGGVNLAAKSESGYLYREGGIISPDGHCRAFDQKAAGTSVGEGIGIVVLKSLERVIDDRDNILALVKGTAMNNDGRRKVGYTAPSIVGQAQVIQIAHQVAEVEPESISYIETHGTATQLGDPVELEALTRAFNSPGRNFCGIGSVKTNIGHLDSAAGVAGFIKTVLMLMHKTMPPSLHFETPNPKIDFDNSPFYVNTGTSPWNSDDGPLRAGVSSFGIGGTNAHIVLEEWNGSGSPDENRTPHRPYQLMLLSAKTQAALDRMTENMVDRLKQKQIPKLPDISYTLQLGRKPFSFRRALVCQDVSEAIESLSDPGSRKVETFFDPREEAESKIVFMFPGLGSQYTHMGLGLYRDEPLFRKEADRCFEIVNPLLDYDIKAILYPGEVAEKITPPPDVDTSIQRTERAQLAVFIFGYALAKLLISWGIKPSAMIGYSFGEYIAACISGVLSLPDALAMVVTRGKLLREVPQGIMLSIPMPEGEVRQFLNPRISLAIDNGQSCVVSGDTEAVSTLEALMKEKRVMCMRLDAYHAIHSPMMEVLLEEFERKVASVSLNPPEIPYISTVTGDWAKPDDVVSAPYWSRQLRDTVLFKKGLDMLLDQEDAIFLEVGAGKELSAMAIRQIEEKQSEQSGHRVLNLVRKKPETKAEEDRKHNPPHRFPLHHSQTRSDVAVWRGYPLGTLLGKQKPPQGVVALLSL